jgi:arylsulfatase A-like enzyme
MAPSAPPNILLVVADDHRADVIGACGHPIVRTPTLDQLAAEGTSCTRTSIMGGLMPAVCAPSRAALLTGTHVLRADAQPRLVRGPEYQVTLPSDRPTLPEVFSRTGYETFFTGKWHHDLGTLGRAFADGEAIFHGGMCAHERVPVRSLAEIRTGAAPRVADGFSTELFCGAAEAYLRRRNRCRPFFAMVALTSPHDPRTPPPEFRKMYPEARMPLPENFRPAHPFDNGELRIRDELLAPAPRKPDIVRRAWADYCGMISHHDDRLGGLLQVLRKTGAEHHTIVVYTSDHGLALGSHGLFGKQNLYEPSLRVPLILRGPGVPRGHRCPALAYGFDLFATLTDLAGINPPPDLDSRSLVPAWRPGGSPGRDALGSLYMDVQRALTAERWKLIRYRVRELERTQLFDLATDPHELRDRADDPAVGGVRHDLEARLEAWQREIGDRWMPPSGRQPRP